jgi:hypothetical protein
VLHRPVEPAPKPDISLHRTNRRGGSGSWVFPKKLFRAGSGTSAVRVAKATSGSIPTPQEQLPPQGRKYASLPSPPYTDGREKSRTGKALTEEQEGMRSHRTGCMSLPPVPSTRRQADPGAAPARGVFLGILPRRYRLRERLIIRVCFVSERCREVLHYGIDVNIRCAAP